MFGKQKSQFNYGIKNTGRAIFAVVLVFATVIGMNMFAGQVQTAEAAIPKYINFQGKLTAVSNGNNVANGTYAIEFKLYDASSGGSLLWTETYDQAPVNVCQKIQVTNGVFNAKLGTCNALTSVDFTGGALYLTVNFAPTGTSYDGEMSPRKQLVSSAYAFVANGVSGDGKVNATPGQSATALTVARSGSDYAFQVDTNTASSATGLKVTSAAAASGLALNVISSGTNENLTLDAKGSGTISLGSSSTGDILLGGGSGSTGCTVTNSNGNFACTGTVTGSNLSGTNTGDQTITLTGDVTGSGTGSFATTIGSDKILESMLKSVNGPSDEYCLTYEATVGDFEWQTCGSALTPWTSDVNAAGYDLRDLSNLEFQATTGAPAGTVVAIFSDNSGDLNINALSTKSVNLQVAGSDEYNFSSTALAMNGNSITGVGTAITGAAGVTLSSTSANLALTTGTSGDITLAPASTGAVQITSGNAGGTGTSSGLSFVANSLTTGNGATFASSSVSAGAVVSIESTSTAASGQSQRGLGVILSGANSSAGQATYGGYFENYHTGSGTNVGAYFYAIGGSANYALVTGSGNVGIGDVTPTALLTVGSGDAFQVNSSGAIAAATGVTSSGTITFSGLGGGGTQCVTASNTGVLGVASCGSALTPWTSDIDADGYDLNDLSNILFRETTGAPTNTDVALYRDNSGDLSLNVLTAKTFNIAVNATDEYNFSSSALAMNGNNITGVGTAITGAAGVTLSATSADLALATATSGNITLQAASTGSVQITSGVTTGTGTSSGLSVAANSLTTGVGINLASSTLSSGSLANIVVTGTAAASNTQKALNVTTSGANATSTQTTYGGYFSNTHTGTSSTNVGLYATATGGATNNYAAQFDGNVLQNQTSTMTIKGSVNNATSLAAASGVYVSGKYAYVTSVGGDRLTIVDISTPTAPVIMGSLSDATNLDGAISVYVSGRYAYVAAYNTNRLTVVDISNPTSPTLVGTLNDATNLSSPNSVFISGKYAYVAAYGTSRLTIVDISVPTQPVLAGSINDATNLNNAYSVYVTGKYAYVAAFTGDRLTVVDVSNPASPSVVGNINDATNLDGASSVYVSGRYAYVAAFTANRLTVVDISNPASPTVAGSVNDATNLNNPFSVYASGKYAYVTSYTGNRLTVVDISNPASPSVTANINDGTNLNGSNTVYVSGKYAYVSAYVGNRLTVVDITGFEAPTASIGNLASNDITVSENIDIGNNLSVSNALNVGYGGIQSNGALALQGTITGVIQSATALNISRDGTNYAFQVDTNTASSATGLKVTSAAATGGVALSAISSGTNENLTLDAKGSGTLSLGATSTGNILLGGGSGSTGCTVTNSSGAYACTSTIASGVAGGTIGGFLLSGNTSGTISILPQAAAGTYNFNLPTAAGSSGFVLTSAGGGASPMTWTDPSTFTTSSLRLDQITAANTTASRDSLNNAIVWDWSTSTTQTGLTVSASGTGLTSGNALKVSSATTGAVTNGIFQVQATGAYTSTGGALNVTANSTTTGTVAALNGTGLTTGTLLNIGAGTALTTGTALNVSGATYTHTGTNTGKLVTLAFTSASTNAAGTSTVSGLDIIPTFNTSASAGTKTLNGINVAAAFTACGTTSGNCFYNGVKSTNPLYTQSTTNSFEISPINVSSGVLTQDTAAGQIYWRGVYVTTPSITQTTGTIISSGVQVTTGSITTGGTQRGLYVNASNAPAGTVEGLRIETLGTGGAGTERAIAIGYGWDTALHITGTTGQTTQAAIDVASYSYLHTGAETGNLVSLAYTDASSNASGSAVTTGINLTPTIATTASAGSKTINGINIAPTYTSCGTTGGTCIYNGVQQTTAAVTQTTTNNLTINANNISTAGALIQNTAAGTISWVGQNVVMPNITQTSGTVTANGQTITTGTITTGGIQRGVNIAAQGVSAGTLNGINISAITGGAGTETGLTVGSGWDTAIQSAGNYVQSAGTMSVTSANTTQTTTSSAFALNANSVNSGTGAYISTSSLTSGNSLQIVGSGATMTTGGELIDLSLGANTVGAGITITGTGAYTGTGAADGYINVVGNSLTSGHGSKMSFTGMTSGTGMLITGGGANMTAAGELIDLQMGAATVGSGLNITTTGAYTGAGILQLTANSATTGTLAAISSSSLTSGKLLDLTVTGTGATSNTQKALNVSTSGANATSTQTTYGGYFSNTHTGTSSTNIGLYSTATGGTTNNYAAQFDGNILQNQTSTMLVKGSINDATNLNGARSVYVNGKYAYVIAGTGNRLTIVDISNPASPVVTGNINDATNLNGAISVHVAGKYAYVAAQTGDRLTVVDVSNPNSPTVVGNINDGTNLDNVTSVYVSGKYAYVTASGSVTRLTIVDISNPASPTVAGSISDATNLNNPTSVYVSGKYAYVTSYSGNRLTIVDVSNPLSPTVTGNINDATNLSGANSVYVSGKYAYVAAQGSNRLTVVDVSNPASPTVTGNVNDGTNLAGPNGVYVSGKYAYVASGSGNRLTAVDISNPASPTVTGTVNDGTNLNNPGAVFISGKYAYVAVATGNRLTVVDIAGIDAPAASIGNLASNDITVTENIDVGNNIYARNGLNVGSGGIYSNGQISLQGTVLGSGANAIAGIYGDYTMTNSTASGFQYGNRFISRVTSGTAGTHVGEFIRVIDNTSLDSGQNVRGLEVQAYSGTNVNGTNTGIASYGYTFGIQATTTAQAAAQASPAAVFADLDNGTDATTKTRGNAIRAYTNDATSADLVHFYQETSTYTGNGLLMNFGNGGGGFTGNFISLQKGGTESFHVDDDGSTFVSLTGTQTTIALCHANNGTVNNDEIVDCSGAPSDVAEYFGSEDPTLTAGEIVVVGKNSTEMHLDGYHTSKAWIARSTGAYQDTLMGVISTAPAQVYGDEIFSAAENPRPVALVGRVPVKVNLENGPIKAGDFITSSSTPGQGMKATKSGPVIGQALDEFDGVNENGTIIVFIKPTNYNGAEIDDQLAGITFDYSAYATGVEEGIVGSAENSNAILEHLLSQLADLDGSKLSQVSTDVVIAAGEIVTPTVTTQTLRADFLTSATSEGGLEVASTTMFGGGLTVDTIGAIGDLLSFSSDVEFFGTPYFTSDTAGFAVVKAGVQSVDVVFGREYLAQPIVSASVSFEQDIDQDNLDEAARGVLRDTAVADAQAFLTDPVSYVVTNKSKYGFTIVLNKTFDRDIKLSWIALAVRNATTFMSLDAPENNISEGDNGDQGSGNVAGDFTPPADGGSSGGSDSNGGSGGNGDGQNPPSDGGTPPDGGSGTPPPTE